MTFQGDPATVPAAADRELEQVLLGLADGSYVLSTPDGAVAECGVGVMGLLGAPVEALAGRPTAHVLLADADDATTAAFERVLHPGVDDRAAPHAVRARTADGSTRSLELHVVAVPLALGWEFTSLLGELRSRDAGTWHPEALRLRHGRALEAIEGVVRSGRQPDPSARLAGILIVVRDVDAPPLTRDDVSRRMASQRTAARIAAAEAARRADAAAGRAAPPPEGQAGVGVADLEDLVERARVLRERVEEAEREAGAVTLERDQALARLAGAAAEREAAIARAGSLEAVEERVALLASERDEARAALEAIAAELAAARGDVDRLCAELDATREAVHEERAADSESADAERAALRAEADAARKDADALRAALRDARGELEDVRLELDARTQELAGLRAELDDGARELAGVRAESDAATAELDARAAALARAGVEVEAREAALTQARAELERAGAELGTAAAEVEQMRAERDEARLRAERLLAESEQARAAADAIRAEFAFEREATSRPAPFAERAPWNVPAPRGAPAPAPDTVAAKPALPPVGPGRAAALIALDGSFARLDDAFCSLLGCREEDLRAARWPSIIDRENLSDHKEVARALKAGEIDSAEIETVYMHAQGLLVPIAGQISMHRADPEDEATHFLLCADVSRTAGVPGIV